MLKSLSLFLPLVSGFCTMLHAEEELPKVLRFSTPMVSVSAVQGKASMGTELAIENTGEVDFAFAPVFIGKDAAAFSVEPKEIVVGAGKTESFTVHLSPVRGAGSYVASLDVAEGSIPVRGVGLKAFEGNNEPSFDRVAKALGMEVDVGGATHSLSTADETVGESITAARFRGIAGKPVRITPVARFSPPGEVPFGIVFKDDELTEWGTLDNSGDSRPDNHQCLFPGINGGAHAIEKEAPKEPFAFYMTGHMYVSFTDPALNAGAPIKHTARVYPVKKYQGRELENAYLIGFEEAKNGDYQDAVFLLENVTAE